MRFTAAAGLAALLIASPVLIGCGTSSASNSPIASLNGNWLLAGSRQLKQYPFLTTAVITRGNTIVVQGDFMVGCANSPGGAVGGSLYLAGQAASDGNFQISETPDSSQINSIQVSVQGKLPPAGSSTWSGTYSFTDLAGYTSCIVNQTASFTATALPPVNATYGGTLTGSSGNITVSSTITQGTPTSQTTPIGSVDYLVPLSGTITVTGSPCFTHGTTAPLSNQIEGDLAALSFTMDDGSQVLFNGFLSIPDETVIYPATFVVFNGKCSQNSYSGTLTRQ